jgi:hypothetical protein
MNFSPQQRQVDVTRTALAGAGISTPAGVVSVWFLNTYCLPHPMPAEIGTAFGSLVAAAVLWLVQWLPQRRGL